MAFVYTSWYIVLALLIIGVIATIAIVVMMDKKDKLIISEFIQSSNEESVEQKETESAVSETEKTNE